MGNRPRSFLRKSGTGFSDITGRGTSASSATWSSGGLSWFPAAGWELSDLPRSILEGAGASRPESRSWQEARAAFESDFLTRKLRQFGGNISRTAAEIGMERSHLHRKLKAYGISVGASRGKRGGRQELSDAARGRNVNR